MGGGHSVGAGSAGAAGELVVSSLFSKKADIISKARHAGTEVGTRGHETTPVHDAFQRHVRVAQLEREEQQTGRIHTAGAGNENMA